jgi:hypothetical protein
MRRSAYILLITTLLPAGLSGQQNPVDRLAEVLPAEVAARVIEQIETAQARALPAGAVANLALEGVAKGRSADEVLSAVEALVVEMGVAHDAIRSAGRAPGAGEVEAAAAAMRMGVDGSSIQELARAQPTGRSLAVPMLVMGGLAQRGLPSDQALERVSARLAAQADDAALMNDVPRMGSGTAVGGMPAQVGPTLAGVMAGFQVPVAGIDVPVGPNNNMGRRPTDVPRGPGDNPNPPGGPGGPGS